MPKPHFREHLKAETIAIARRILATEGLSALQARRIAHEAGCSVGTIYNLYSNLDDLVVVANAGTLEDLGAALVQSLESSTSEKLGPRLIGLGLAYLTFAIESEQAWRAVFEHRLDADQSVPEWYRVRQSELFDIVKHELVEPLTDDVERDIVARALFAAVHGIVTLALDQKLGLFDRTGTEAQIKFIVGAAARGIIKNQEA